MRYFRLFRDFVNGWLYLAVKFGLTSQEPLRLRARNGVVVEVPRRLLQTFKEIFMDDSYGGPAGYPRHAGASVIDIGANAGYFTLFAAAKFAAPRIAAYEPVPKNFAQLKRNRDLNPGQDIRLHAKAVAGQRGEIELAFSPDDTFTTEASLFKTGEGLERIQVATVSLAEAMEENGFSECDFLKMDCEGAEYEIFYRCPDDVLARIRRIAMEVHRGPEPDQNIGALSAFLAGKGFVVSTTPLGLLWAWRS